MDLRQIHMENVLFGPSLGRVWMSRSAEVKVTKDKKAFFGPFGGLRAVCVW